jgi:hypothetical protein
MTKLSLTKILKEVRGTLGKTLTTFRVWKERQVLEDYPKPTYTRTSKQDQQRIHYRYCCDKWHTLTDEEKASYKEKASNLGLTAFNVFMSECLKAPMIVFKYKVTINNTQLNENLTNYQIKLVVSNDSFFFNDFNNSHQYLEVYDSDQTTMLNFWVEQWDITNHNATIWIKVPSIQASSSRIIYLAYNPNRTATLSSKDKTLDFYDDFDVDLSKWTQLQGTWTIENGNLKSPSIPLAFIRTASFTIKNVRIKARIALQGGLTYNYAGIIARVQNTDNLYLAGIYGELTQLRMYKRVGGTWTQLTYCSQVHDLNYHEYEFRLYESRLEFWRDGVLKLLATDTSLPGPNYIGFSKTGQGYYFYVDYVYVTKYAYPEPTVSYTKL